MNHKENKYITKIKQAVANNNDSDIKKYSKHLVSYISNVGGAKYDMYFKVTNLSELRDETLYSKLKTSIQKEYLFMLVLFYITNIYIFVTRVIYRKNKSYTWNKLIDNKFYQDEQIENTFGITMFIEEITKWYTYLSEEGINVDVLPKQESLKLDIINLYDESFNGKILLQKIMNLDSLSDTEYYKIIYYCITKKNFHRYFTSLAETIMNTRSIIIGKNFRQLDGLYAKRGLFDFRHSDGTTYHYYDDNITMLKLDAGFKKDVLENNYNDGYDFYWTNIDESLKDKHNVELCNRYFVELYENGFNENTMSIVVTRSPKIPNAQSHFYIKRNLITETKHILNDIFQEKNLAIMIHSFSAWLFDVNKILSNLQDSMRTIFSHNGVRVVTDYSINETYSEIDLCGLIGLIDRINVTSDFKLKWLEIDLYKYDIVREHAHIMIYKLKF